MPRACSIAEARPAAGAPDCDAGGGAGSVADADCLFRAVAGLAQRSPELSAATGLYRWQKCALAGVAGSVAAGVIAVPETTLFALLAVMAIPFLLVVALRAASLWQLLSGRVPQHPCEPVPSRDAALPTYTVLVPLYREAGVVPHLLRALAGIDYPVDKLEVLLIVEHVDGETQAALCAAKMFAHMRVLVVPDGAPRTKPRALQYALQFAHGDYVVVYDAEDVPEPDQLRRALAALRAAPDRLGCLQARLNIYNSRVSWLTRGIMAQTPRGGLNNGLSLANRALFLLGNVQRSVDRFRNSSGDRFRPRWALRTL